MRKKKKKPEKRVTGKLEKKPNKQKTQKAKPAIPSAALKETWPGGQGR